jgi:hypothetical protein
MSCRCCRCPDGLIPLLDRRVVVVTKCGEISGTLRAVGDTFLEIEETHPRLQLTVVQCEQICYVRTVRVHP